MNVTVEVFVWRVTRKLCVLRKSQAYPELRGIGRLVLNSAGASMGALQGGCTNKYLWFYLVRKLSHSATREGTRVYQFITNNHASFHLWWTERLLNHQKVSKYYEHDCRSWTAQKHFITLMVRRNQVFLFQLV